MNYKYRFNRDSYSRETISKFDIIGSYFVHQFYNTLYIKSKNDWDRSENSESLTFIYKKYINRAMYLMTKNRTNRRERLEDLYNYYILKTKYKSYTYKDFLNIIVKELFPIDYFNSLKLHQKQNIFEQTILDTVTAFVNKIEKVYLSNIIDNHDDVDNIKALREEFIDCLLYKREEWYVQLATTTKNNKETVPVGIVDKITGERNVLVGKTQQLKAQLESIKTEYDKKFQELAIISHKLKEKCIQSHNMIDKLNKLLKSKEIQNTKYESEIISLKEQINYGHVSHQASHKKNNVTSHENKRLKSELESIKQELHNTKQELHNTKQELHNTTRELTDIKRDIEVPVKEILSINADVNSVQSKEDEDLDRILQNIPINDNQMSTADDIIDKSTETNDKNFINIIDSTNIGEIF